ncbi:DUF6221 family protein [Streptomyces bauhiniae]
MDNLVQWLTIQLDEDENDVRRGYLRAEPAPDYEGWDKATTAGLPPIVAARVLRETDAKRRIMERYAWLREHGDTGDIAWVLPLLALPYAGRPGYREEWRP